ncbi:MAG TPA: [FeFe] hydrogenase H-cluster radical SAM maturase HydE [Spirochaetota bacterium]|nr:[FeFe] hydrogenase H-cluster radical SAM maturase HydE [Spirochaetota bacterium]
MNLSDILDFYKSSQTDELINKADEVCRTVYGDKVFLRGLIEFSNYCDKDCLYCGIRNSNTTVHRYRLTENEIIQTVKEGFKSGLKTFVLQSGEDDWYSQKKLCYIIDEIKKVTDNEAALTLSCGIKTKSQYGELKSAGCDRYLIRFETSDENLHKYLRGGISLKRRLQALDDLKSLDFEVGSGYMVGLPEETEETRINNAILCYNYNFDMVGIGPFIPHPDTPLADTIQQPIDLAIRATALIRLLLPKSNIPATTAAGTLDKDGREKILKSGANVLMPNITPTVYKKDYLLYPNKICIDESGFQCIGCLSGRVKSIDKTLSFERGDSISFLERMKD